jgi:Cu2+-exporting ATPase
MSHNEKNQNLFFAFFIIMYGIPIAAGFYILGLYTDDCCIAMSFSSVSVIANALRLRNLKL